MTNDGQAGSETAANRGAFLTVDLMYGLITLGTSTIWSVLGGWLLYFYMPPDADPLVPVAFYGVGMLVIRVISAAITPPIGYWSDHTRTRWGRRLPWMFLSGLPMLIAFVLLWTPPIDGESVWNLLYMLGMMLVYTLTYTANQIPYMALLPDLAATDKHRVRISAWTSGTLLVGMILGGLAGLLIDKVGYAVTALIYAATMLPTFYLPMLSLKEKRDYTSAGPRLGFWRGLASLTNNKAFVVMTACGFCFWSMTSLVQALVPYVVTEVCLLDEADTWLFYIPGIAAGLVSYPAVMWLSGKWGKWVVFAGSLLASAFALPSLVLIGDWLPLSLKAQGIIWITLQALALSGVAMLPPAFGAEIIDHDEHLTGERREGTFYGVWGVLDQTVDGVLTAVLPLVLLLGRSHTDPHGPLGVRVAVIGGGALLLLGFFIMLRYPFKKGLPAAGAKNEEAR